MDIHGAMSRYPFFLKQLVCRSEPQDGFLHQMLLDALSCGISYHGFRRYGVGGAQLLPQKDYCPPTQPLSLASYVCVSQSVVFDSAILGTVACQAPWSMGFFSKNTGVGCHSLLQGILPIQESNSGLPCITGRLFTTEPPGRPVYGTILSMLFS